ncbi:hypothetical protein AB1287_00275 [Enterobacter asburiae]|uniref:hypothetical protein n=1 Tax=Scandinavium sp. UTDF21-P1B TaxID=3446379 RepID=UPI00346E798C
MRSGQMRRVNLSLHLSPETSRADQRAMMQLKTWHEAVQQTGSGVTEANMEIRRFHRHVYLAGLQLHLLKPQLCSRIAESLGREALTLESLCAELQHDGLLPGEAPETTTAAATDFSQQQLEQMRTLMTQMLPAPSPAASESGASEETAMLRREVAELKTLLEQQHLLLQQLRVSGRNATAQDSPRNAQAEEVDLSAVDAPTQKMNKVRQKGIF